MASVPTAADYIGRMLLSGFFPLLPWTGFVMVGTAAGEWLFCKRPSLGSGVALALSLSIVGALLAARGIEMVFFPPSLSFTFAVSGICLLVLCAAAKWHVPGTRLLAPLGRLSLTLFVAHHFLGYLGVRAAGGLNSLELLPDLLMVIVSWLLCILLSWLWSAADYRYGLEWLIASAERRATKGINTPPEDSGRRSRGGKDDAPGRAS
jgi:uncharacterized protein